MIKAFIHYSDASQRKACTLLTERFGDKGYAFWFRTLEYLNQHDAEPLDLSNENTLFLFSLYVNPTQKTSDERIAEVLTMLDFCAQYKDENRQALIDTDLWESGRQVWSKNNYDNVSKILKRRKREQEINPDDPMLEFADIMWKDVCNVYPSYAKKPKKDQLKTVSSWVPHLHITAQQYQASLKDMVEVWRWMHDSTDEQARFWRGVVRSAKSWHNNFPTIQGKYTHRNVGKRVVRNAFDVQG